MKVIAAALLALLAASCAPSLEAANERGGIMPRVIGLNRAGAFSSADEHCKKYGRVARVSATDPWNSTMTFDCVAP